MTVRGGKLWWFVGAVVGLGLAVLAVGWFLTRAGLEDADRWASVIGVFLNVVGVAMAVIGVLQGRRSSCTGAGTVGGPVVPGLDSPPSNPVAPGDAGAGAVENRIEGGEFRGPVFMGRDMYGVKPPSPSGNTVGKEG